jgi:plasmid stability protein
MKTTLDLPPDLVRKMKLRAVHQGRKLKDVAAEVFRRGLDQPETAAKPATRHRITLPLIQCALDAPASRLSAEEIIALEQESQTRDNLERLGLSL